jgi:hypothetical protein
MEFYTIHGAGHRQCTCAALPSDFRRLACPWSQPTSTPLAFRRSRGCSSIFDLSDVSNSRSLPKSSIRLKGRSFWCLM